jgi:phosphoribosylamine-glycine ligase
VMMDMVPRVVGRKVEKLEMMCTAGPYPLVVTGSGNTVSTAAQRALDHAWAVEIPSNRMMRTDVGKRLKKDLPAIQKFGFAKGMVY